MERKSSSSNIQEFMAFFNDSLSNQNLSIPPLHTNNNKPQLPHSAMSFNNYVHEDTAETVPISSKTFQDSSADKNKVKNKHLRASAHIYDHLLAFLSILYVYAFPLYIICMFPYFCRAWL